MTCTKTGVKQGARETKLCKPTKVCVFFNESGLAIAKKSEGMI